ncbi:MAG: hypothetical protein IJZ20_04920 [Clostridia bacterium]|nr:hypothetical protein [Clostridia bacterium]
MKTAYEFAKENIRKQKHSMSYKGEKLADWQKAAREKLSELLGMDKFEKVSHDVEIEYENTENGVAEMRFTFQSEEGYRVPCHLMMPENAEKPPVVIALQGHSTGMHISLGKPKYDKDEKTIKGGDRDFCVRAVKEGYAAIALEQRNFGECGGDEHGPQCWDEVLTSFLLGRTTIGERVWDVSNLIDVLEENFSELVDTKNIVLMGNSGGGTATAYAAALEDRITLAMPSCAVCTYADSIGTIHHCHCNYVPRIAEFFDMGDLIAMSYPKYYVQVSGKEDPIFPIAGAEECFEAGKAAYATENAEDRLALVIGNGAHRFYADDSWPVVHKYLNK